MKKIMVTIMALIYLGSVSGVTLHMHYCMGELAGWGFWKDDSTHCGLCGMEKKQTDDSGCCTDEQKQIKATDDQKIPESLSGVIKQFQKELYHSPEIHSSSNELKAGWVQPAYHAPPRYPSSSLYLIHCIFLI